MRLAYNATNTCLRLAYYTLRASRLLCARSFTILKTFCLKESSVLDCRGIGAGSQCPRRGSAVASGSAAKRAWKPPWRRLHRVASSCYSCRMRGCQNRLGRAYLKMFDLPAYTRDSKPIRCITRFVCAVGVGLGIHICGGCPAHQSRRQAGHGRGRRWHFR